MPLPHRLGAVIMMKNEAATILLTIKSVVGTVDCLCCYDTGSTDDTVELVEACCKQNKLPFYLTRGVFVDFSTSRNVLVEFAEKYCEYQLHLDSADVLRGGQALNQFVKQYKGSATAFMIFQQWFMGRTSIRFRNLRLMKSGYGYRYKCRVHEMLMKPNFDSEKDTCGIDTKFDERAEVANDPQGSDPLSGFVIFQNRTLDNTKTLQRFHRDAVMLYDDWEADPEDTRTLFYLGQTYDHMGDPQKGYIWYQKRVNLAHKGFSEEALHAHMRLGKLAQRIGMDEEIVEKHYWQAIEFSMKYWNGRVLLEPVMLLVAILDNRKDFAQAFSLLRSILDEPYPVHMNLFVDASAYKYLRYHWMGRVGWYVGQHTLGGWCALVAYRAEGLEIDLKNLKVYLNMSPHKSKWENGTTLARIIKSCPDLNAFERAWTLGDVNFPNIEAGPPSIIDTSIQKQQPVPDVQPQATLTSKQKLEMKRKQQRLLRKAK